MSSSSSSSSLWSVILLTIIISILLNPPRSHSFTLFQQTNNNVTLFGDAFFTAKNNTFSLTQELSACRSSSPTPTTTTTTTLFPFHNNGVGRALYSRPVSFLDPSTNTTASFSTTFTFSIVPSALCSSGDGLAFLVASDAIPDDPNDFITAAKGHIGLPSLQESFFAVEFDTSFDPLLGDLDADHVGVDVNTAVSVVSVDVRPRGIDLKSGREITAWVEYRNPTSLVRVWLAYSRERRPPNPVLEAQVDLSGLFGEFAFVGFTGSNGLGSSLHIVSEWKFKTFRYHDLVQLPMDSFEEGDCFICSDSAIATTVSIDGDEKVRLRSRKAGLVGDSALGIGGLVAFLVSAVAILGVVSYVVIERRNLAQGTRVESRAFRLRNTRAPMRHSLADIRAATMGFDQARIVGKGASATVYKGSLPDGAGEVAVKRFQRDLKNAVVSCSSRHHAFTNEFATMAGCLRHKNLMQLQGWCCEGSETLLIYEYMPNGSLDKILHDRTVALPWKRRLDILLGVASALTFLHEECERQIIHRDVKTCNIMLDAEFNAKLGDLGLAEVFEHCSHSRASRDAAAPAGTMGYLAPEYVCSGVASPKTDVYSFGVVILEVGTGRRAVEGGVGLVDWVWGMWEGGRLGAAIDTRLEGRTAEKEAERMLIVGLACVHPNHVERLTAKEAARMLKREMPLPALPVQRPRLWPRTVLHQEFGSEESRSVDTELFLTPKSNFDRESLCNGVSNINYVA